MDEIGQILKQTREENNLSIDKVVNDLKVSYTFIKKIEDNNFDEYYNNAYLIGHVRAYSNYLNLDSNEIIKKLKIQTSFSKKDFIDELPKPIGNNNFTFNSKFVPFFSIIFLAMGFYFLFIKSNQELINYAMTPNIPENLESKIEEFEMSSLMSDDDSETFISSNNIALNHMLETNKIIISDSEIESDMSINQKIEINKSSVIASLPSNEDIINIQNLVTLSFLGSTWIQVRDVDENIIISKLMNLGDEYSFSIDSNYSLTSGNAGNILISINGETRGKAGKTGEVIDSLIINSEFNN